MLALWLGLAALGALAAFDVVPWWQPPRRGPEAQGSAGSTYADVASVAFVLGLLLLGPVGAATVSLPARLVELVRVRTGGWRHLYVTAGFVAAGAAGWGVFHLMLNAQGVGQTAIGRPGWLLAAAVAATSYELVNLAVGVTARRMVHGLASPRRELSQVYPLWTETAACAIAVLVALLWRLHPWLTVTAVFPVLVLRRALQLRDLELTSRTDAKTGLANYGWFREVAEREVRRALRHETALSLLVLDLDHLREINTAHGHLAGDVVLKGIADILDTDIREFDLVCRFGGEEFVILLPSTDIAEAKATGERLRDTVDRQTFHAPTAAVPLQATVSVGVSLLGDHGASLEELLHSADIAVYRAKEAGRNQVCVAGGAPPRQSGVLS